MTLSELINDLEGRLPRCSGFAVVTFRKSDHEAAGGKPESKPVIDAYPDDSAEEIILRVGDRSEGMATVTLAEMLGILNAFPQNRREYSVECSSDDPSAEWRLDFPLAGVGENSSAKLVALVTA